MMLSDAYDIGTFLDAIITTDEGWFCMALAAQNASTWADQWFKWPDDRALIIEHAHRYAPSYNVYFSSFLFSVQSRTKTNVLPTRTIQADLDEADLSLLPITPFAVVETSPGRYQGYWVLNELIELDALETLSRKLTYAIDKADHSGWPLGRTARLPNTFNYKYLDGPATVKVISFGAEPVSPAIFELLPDADRPTMEDDDNWLTAEKPPLQVGPLTLLDSLRDAKKLPAKIVQQYGKLQQDRSAALWALTTNLFRAGCSRDVVYQLAWGSANNKFATLRYGGERELAKDVLRAEAVAKRRYADTRAEIRDLRMQPGHAHILRAAIARKVMETMLAEGDFLHTTDNALYYVKRDIGKPVAINRASEQLNALLNVRFGLNKSEVEQAYALNDLLSYTVSLPANTKVGALSHYNGATNILSVHTGLKDVFNLTTESVMRVPNGSGGMLFPWHLDNDPFTPDMTPLADGKQWHDIVFGDTFKNTADMTPAQAGALMRVWTLFVLMRAAAYTKPVLAFLGTPGAGKSTIMRRLYRLYYGKRKELLKAKSEEQLDLVSTEDPFMVLDNLDTWASWIPDWLATAITNTDVPRRKLYTDGDMYHMTRQAIVGLTAHNPKFGRPDVADRLLMITFTRHTEFAEETLIHEQIIRNRNKLWGGIFGDIQKVLREPLVAPQDVPKFRIADFAAVGLRIARALGVPDEFVAAIKAVAVEQRLFSLEEEIILVTALKQLVLDDTKRERTGRERTSGTLWSELALLSGDVETFKRLYRDAVRLSKKLAAMTEPLSQVFEITSRTDAEHGTKVWTVRSRNGLIHNTLNMGQLSQLATIERTN